jgi:small subunit ribosomal protein S12
MATFHQRGIIFKKVRKFNYNPLRSMKYCPHRRGIVVKVRIVTPKKPNSARRKVARVRLSTGFMITARIKGQGHNLQAYSTVLVAGGRANDLPGVRYSLVKGSLDFSWREDFKRSKSRSKYGISLESFSFDY